MKLSRRRGQFQILGALILIILMVQVRFMVIREYSPTLHESAGDIELTQSELKRITLTSLAYASNVQGDPTTNFQSRLQILMADMSVSHFEFALTASSSQAVLNWPGENSTGNGSSVGSTQIRVESKEPIATWNYNVRFQVDQKISSGVTYTQTLPGLIKVVIPLNLTLTTTLNGSTLSSQPDKWQSTTVTYPGGHDQATLVKDKGDGRMILEVFIPYSGAGTYYMRVQTWDANNVCVFSAFDLQVS